MAKRLEEKVQEMQSLVAKLGLLEDAHVEYTLLRSCTGACQLLYSLRGTPLGPDSLTVMRKADDSLHKAWEKLLKTSVSPAAWTQAGLRTSEGGLGLRHLEDVCHSAFLGGF